MGKVINHGKLQICIQNNVIYLVTNREDMAYVAWFSFVMVLGIDIGKLFKILQN
jgi:hypothetical protein